jgi:hypothetical protein
MKLTRNLLSSVSGVALALTVLSCSSKSNSKSPREDFNEIFRKYVVPNDYFKLKLAESRDENGALVQKESFTYAPTGDEDVSEEFYSSGKIKSRQISKTVNSDQCKQTLQETYIRKSEYFTDTGDLTKKDYTRKESKCNADNLEIEVRSYKATMDTPEYEENVSYSSYDGKRRTKRVTNYKDEGGKEVRVLEEIYSEDDSWTSTRLEGGKPVRIESYDAKTGIEKTLEVDSSDGGKVSKQTRMGKRLSNPYRAVIPGQYVESVFLSYNQEHSETCAPTSSGLRCVDSIRNSDSKKLLYQKEENLIPRYIPVVNDVFNGVWKEYLQPHVQASKILFQYLPTESVENFYYADGKAWRSATEKATYNDFGQLVRRERLTDDGNGNKSSEIEENTYDMDGARILQKVLTKDGKKVTTSYTY